ncbi:MAG: hypothetical protein IVW53_13605 [Chloroflexi bacterium]|nr:hypothetical protein [Chloroflexota bacterium]
MHHPSAIISGRFYVLKKKLPRFLLLFGTMAGMASLIGVAVVGTGAYFTDSVGGQISGNLGTVAVAVSGQNINFANLMPGEVQTQAVTVKNTGTGNEDIYLAFDNTNKGWSAVNDLGQYGKFVINGKTYDNLSNKYNSTTGVPGAPISGVFMGGSCSTVNRVPVNFLPHVILLGTLTPNQTWTFNIAFNIIACKSDGGGADLWSSIANDFSPLLTGPLPLNFKIAAFQPGVNPNDPFNGAGQIAPLSLPITNYAPGIYQ